MHAWLPAGRRGFLQILPGIVFTMVASLISGIAFGHISRALRRPLCDDVYAGLASVVIALVFLYFIAAIFVYGGGAQRRDHQVAVAARRVASSSAVASALGDTGLSRKGGSAPASREPASSSPRPETPMMAI